MSRLAKIPILWSPFTIITEIKNVGFCCFSVFNKSVVKPTSSKSFSRIFWGLHILLPIRAIFNWVSKVIRDCIGFALLRSVIGQENSRHPLSQSDAKVKPIATWLLAFSRASGPLHVLTLLSDWSVMTFIFVLIGRWDYFGFGFTTLN